ncbi:hypothetical protein PanWU01x14_354120 [Parasponia andersonii]|uniref:Uncharacterized protein n=1 Tax=Parasponia andersonii TaxID=3476 RepID=A0A2P5A9U6_PARAD|nr:hypothetical protein PanWU01x14_354120 [Parasponia andersonii]
MNIGLVVDFVCRDDPPPENLALDCANRKNPLLQWKDVLGKIGVTEIERRRKIKKAQNVSNSVQSATRADGTEPLSEVSGGNLGILKHGPSTSAVSELVVVFRGCLDPNSKSRLNPTKPKRTLDRKKVLNALNVNLSGFNSSGPEDQADNKKRKKECSEETHQLPRILGEDLTIDTSSYKDNKEEVAQGSEQEPAAALIARPANEDGKHLPATKEDILLLQKNKYSDSTHDNVPNLDFGEAEEVPHENPKLELPGFGSTLCSPSSTCSD